MPRAIGVLAMEHIAVGLVEDGTLAAPIRVFPPLGSSSVGLHAMPPDKIAETIKTEILAVAGDHLAQGSSCRPRSTRCCRQGCRCTY